MPEEAKYQSISIQVQANETDLRADKLLANHPLIKNRSRASKLIEKKLVTYKNQPIKASEKFRINDTLFVHIPLENPIQLQPYNFKLDYIFEDEELIVINKPSGLVVHPAAGHAQDTLVNALIADHKSLSMGFNENRPGIVHRLDKETSGVLVVAKNDDSHRLLAEQFAQKTTHRVYWALVYDELKTKSGRIESHLARHPKDRKKFTSVKGNINEAKLAITNYQVLNSHLNVSLVKCQLETGRTHQIRIHLSELGHPILGDQIYGKNSRSKNLNSVPLKKLIQNLNRIGLHAAELGFYHPKTGEQHLYKAPWPDNLKLLVELLKF